MATVPSHYQAQAWQAWATATTTTSSSSSTAWYQWQNMSATAGTPSNVWRYWTDGTTTTTATVTMDATWATWNTTAYQLTPQHQYVPMTQERLAQLQAERKAAAAIRDAELAEQARKVASAKAKAEASLKEMLTPEQELAWVQNRHIFVTGQSGKRYKIKEGMTHNFFEVDVDGTPLKEFCAHLSWEAKCNVIDNVIAQLLALKFNEAHIVKKANVWDLTQNRKCVQRSS